MFSVGHDRISGDPDNSTLARSGLGYTAPELFPENRSEVVPAVTIAGFTGYNSGDRIRSGQSPYMLRDDFTRVAGAHTFKFGVFLIRSHVNENTNVRDEGMVTFNTSALNSTRNVIGDVLLGNFQQYQEWQSDTYFRPRYWTIEMYAQDKVESIPAPHSRSLGAVNILQRSKWPTKCFHFLPGTTILEGVAVDRSTDGLTRSGDP